ncbi:MAG: RluA family pseudouridine synthase [Candidatus Margulisiibacteriota bacterium]|nr:RluA family pseudouridine synthase [Candidatus Margulisiibacteriota bacterium]
MDREKLGEGIEYIISDKQKGERIDHFLAMQKKVGITRSQAKKLIEDGFVEVNKEVTQPSYKLKVGDRVQVFIPEPKKLEAKAENIPLDIVYEDKDLIVVNKPRGTVVHPAAGNYSGTLVNALLHHCKDLSGIGGVLRPGIVHRLDKQTSGLIVVAKNDLTHQVLSKQFKNRKIKKHYIALVHGEIEGEGGLIDARIGRHPKSRKKMAVTGKGRAAISYYKVLKRAKKFTLVDVKLKTGRTHQIRVHMASIGHPLVGDPTYGHRKEDFETNGQMLHAKKLGFEHPGTKKFVQFEAELPKDMAELIRKLQVK